MLPDLLWWCNFKWRANMSFWKKKKKKKKKKKEVIRWKTSCEFDANHMWFASKSLYKSHVIGQITCDLYLNHMWFVWKTHVICNKKTLVIKEKTNTYKNITYYFILSIIRGTTVNVIEYCHRCCFKKAEDNNIEMLFIENWKKHLI